MQSVAKKRDIAVKGIRPAAIVKVQKDNAVSVGRVEFICVRDNCKMLAIVDQKGDFSEVGEEKCRLHRAGSGNCYFSTSGEAIGKYGLYAY